MCSRLLVADRSRTNFSKSSGRHLLHNLDSLFSKLKVSMWNSLCFYNVDSTSKSLCGGLYVEISTFKSLCSIVSKLKFQRCSSQQWSATDSRCLAPLCPNARLSSYSPYQADFISSDTLNGCPESASERWQIASDLLAQCTVRIVTVFHLKWSPEFGDLYRITIQFFLFIFHIVRGVAGDFSLAELTRPSWPDWARRSRHGSQFQVETFNSYSRVITARTV